MTREQFDDTFTYYSLSELIQQATSKRKLKERLETFKCVKNLDLQDFLHNKAITFEINLRAKTYLYIDNSTKDVAAYYTIAISTLHTDGISNETIKYLDGYKDDVKTIPCFLIGQLGKADCYKQSKIGEYILADAIEVIDNSQNSLGGRFILIDSVNDARVLSFYKENSFLAIETGAEKESIKMIKPYFNLTF